MDFKESLVFALLLVSALDLAESLPSSSHSEPTQEYESWRSKRDIVDLPQGTNDSIDISNTLFSGRALDYGYGECDGPNTWPGDFPTCGGHRQSPININLAKSIHLNNEYNLIMRNYNQKPTSMTLRNTGKTIVIEGVWPSGKRPFIKGGILKGEYIFEQLHLHWGASVYEPSDHLINGYSFPLELHVIHYKKKYGSFTNALNYEDGLAVIAYVHELKEEDNPDLQYIIDQLPHVLNPTDPIKNLTPFRINRLAPRFNSDFVTYKGSLTVPPCNEVITWIVYLKPLNVSCTQVDRFRQIKDSHGNSLIRNFRPIQKLNGRKVFLVSKYFFY